MAKSTGMGKLDLLSSPWVLLPAAAGLTMLLASWVIGREIKLLIFLALPGSSWG